MAIFYSFTPLFAKNKDKIIIHRPCALGMCGSNCPVKTLTYKRVVLSRLRLISYIYDMTNAPSVKMVIS